MKFLCIVVLMRNNKYVYIIFLLVMCIQNSWGGISFRDQMSSKLVSEYYDANFNTIDKNTQNLLCVLKTYPALLPHALNMVTKKTRKEIIDKLKSYKHSGNNKNTITFRDFFIINQKLIIHKKQPEYDQCSDDYDSIHFKENSEVSLYVNVSRDGMLTFSMESENKSLGSKSCENRAWQHSSMNINNSNNTFTIPPEKLLESTITIFLLVRIIQEHILNELRESDLHATREEVECILNSFGVANHYTRLNNHLKKSKKGYNYECNVKFFDSFILLVTFMKCMANPEICSNFVAGMQNTSSEKRIRANDIFKFICSCFKNMGNDAETNVKAFFSSADNKQIFTTIDTCLNMIERMFFSSSYVNGHFIVVMNEEQTQRQSSMLKSEFFHTLLTSKLKDLENCIGIELMDNNNKIIICKYLKDLFIRCGNGLPITGLTQGAIVSNFIKLMAKTCQPLINFMEEEWIMTKKIESLKISLQSDNKKENTSSENETMCNTITDISLNKNASECSSCTASVESCSLKNHVITEDDVSDYPFKELSLPKETCDNKPDSLYDYDQSGDIWNTADLSSPSFLNKWHEFVYRRASSKDYHQNLRARLVTKIIHKLSEKMMDDSHLFANNIKTLKEMPDFKHAFFQAFYNIFLLNLFAKEQGKVFYTSTNSFEIVRMHAKLLERAIYFTTDSSNFSILLKSKFHNNWLVPIEYREDICYLLAEYMDDILSFDDKCEEIINNIRIGNKVKALDIPDYVCNCWNFKRWNSNNQGMLDCDVIFLQYECNIDFQNNNVLDAPKFIPGINLGNNEEGSKHKQMLWLLSCYVTSLVQEYVDCPSEDLLSMDILLDRMRSLRCSSGYAGLASNNRSKYIFNKGIKEHLIYTNKARNYRTLQYQWQMLDIDSLRNLGEYAQLMIFYCHICKLNSNNHLAFSEHSSINCYGKLYSCFVAAMAHMLSSENGNEIYTGAFRIAYSIANNFFEIINGALNNNKNRLCLKEYFPLEFNTDTRDQTIRSILTQCASISSTNGAIEHLFINLCHRGAFKRIINTLEYLSINNPSISINEYMKRLYPEDIPDDN